MRYLSPRFSKALSYASDLHASQLRKGTTIPYVSHLLAVGSIVLEAGGDEDEAVAALLHDGPEDQGGQVTLDYIRDVFGDRVADIVEHCSDSLVDVGQEDKEPWLERKQRYIERLRSTLDRSVYLVSAADKLHNARSIARDYERVGEDLWKRFNGGRKGTLWYYEALISVYQEGPEDLRRDQIVDELKFIIDALREAVLRNAT